MYIILNRANLVVCVTSTIKRVRQQENGLVALAAEREAATAIYAADNDAFYPLTPSGTLGEETYRAVEVESVPDEVVPGYWYYTGEFFTTPEKEAEYEKAQAELAAQKVASIAFVTLATDGHIDDITITENASQFPKWDENFTGKAGTIIRDEGALYRSIHDVGAGQNTKPSETPAMWTRVGDPSEEWPEWIQPIGAHDSYGLGAKVSHAGKKWIAAADNNTWEPGVYGWAEYEEE